MSERILLIEDDENIRFILTSYLTSEGYHVDSASNGEEGLKLFYKNQPDLVISDVNMPVMDGFQVCQRIKSKNETRLIPVVLLTSLDDEDSYINGIEAGADDFINKPANQKLFSVRIRSLLKTKLLNDKLDNSWNLLFSLAKAVEAKDEYTENHTIRVAELSFRFGQLLNLSEETNEQLYQGGMLHDIGKIGVPDNILNKPGRLSDKEFKIIQTHTDIGKEICEPLNSMKSIVDIVYLHHEKFNGKGYPLGLKGDAIPVTAQIVSIVDVYDALVSDRPYRKAFPEEKVLNILKEEKNNSFNPELIDIFLNKVLA